MSTVGTNGIARHCNAWRCSRVGSVAVAAASHASRRILSPREFFLSRLSNSGHIHLMSQQHHEAQSTAAILDHDARLDCQNLDPGPSTFTPEAIPRLNAAADVARVF